MKRFFYLLVVVWSIAGCDTDVDPPCENWEGRGCSATNPYSCDGSPNCYPSLDSCQVSVECD